jgi:hypothetical protein
MQARGHLSLGPPEGRVGLSITQLTSAPRQGVGAYIQFLINEFATVQVAAEDENCWVLVTGRIAKKATEGSSWIWAQDVDEEHFEPEHLEYLLSRVSVQETEGVDTPRVSSCSYSFGNWGYHTNDHDSELMPGFSSTPPGAEICGHYKVIYIAALLFDKNKQRANIILRRQPKNGSILIKKSSRPFTIGVDSRLGTPGPLRSVGRVTSPTIFDGEVSLSAEGSMINRYFGPGYKFYGFEANSEANLNYNSIASNACLIVTKRNDNKGRLYRVDQPKAFKLVDSEGGVVANESASFDSQEHESMEARRSCKCRHFSFLCRELGLPCSASALITSYVRHQPFFIFAEPGDIWIDIRLSTPVRTYVLARRERPDLDAQSVPAGLAENFPHGL